MEGFDPTENTFHSNLNTYCHTKRFISFHVCIALYDIITCTKRSIKI